jgi:hypothetical protein
MNLVSLPDGRIVNLDYLTYVEQTGDYVSLHLAGGGDAGSIIRVKKEKVRGEFWRISMVSSQ